MRSLHADLRNDRVLSFYEEQGIALLRMLTDRGSEHCGKRAHHANELYLNLENIEATRTHIKLPQTNRMGERFHQTMHNEFYTNRLLASPTAQRKVEPRSRIVQ